MIDPVLRVASASVGYGAVQAVRDVSFDVHQREAVGVIGPNGAGKSSLLAGLSGHAPLTNGEVELAGAAVTDWPAWRRAAAGLGRTFQRTRVFGTLTAAENVMVPMRVSPLRALVRRCPRARRHADALLDLMGLADVADVQAKNLSVGMQRRLEIARALAVEPKILLLDEPAAGLPSSECDRLCEVIRDVQDRGVAVLLVEHKIPFLFSVCSRVLVLHLGELIAEGSPREVQLDERVIAAYLGRRRSRPPAVSA